MSTFSVGMRVEPIFVPIDRVGKVDPEKIVGRIEERTPLAITETTRPNKDGECQLKFEGRPHWYHSCFFRPL